jgi:hypothetical protein
LEHEPWFKGNWFTFQGFILVFLHNVKWNVYLSFRSFLLIFLQGHHSLDSPKESKFKWPALLGCILCEWKMLINKSEENEGGVKEVVKVSILLKNLASKLRKNNLNIVECVIFDNLKLILAEIEQLNIYDENNNENNNLVLIMWFWALLILELVVVDDDDGLCCWIITCKMTTILMMNACMKNED